MAEILEGEGVGIALDDFSPESLRAGVERLLELVANADIPQRCDAVAERIFRWSRRRKVCRYLRSALGEMMRVLLLTRYGAWGPAVVCGSMQYFPLLKQRN